MSVPPASPLPAGVGKPALRALAAAGLTDLRQIAAVSDDALLALHGVGPKAVRLLRAALSETDAASGDRA